MSIIPISWWCKNIIFLDSQTGFWVISSILAKISHFHWEMFQNNETSFWIFKIHVNCPKVKIKLNFEVITVFHRVHGQKVSYYILFWKDFYHRFRFNSNFDDILRVSKNIARKVRLGYWIFHYHSSNIIWLLDRNIWHFKKL